MTEIFDIQAKHEIDPLQGKYRHIFINPLGIDVLSDILSMCHFGCTLDPENKVQISEYNVGVAILAKCGIFSDETFGQVVDALCSVIPQKKEEDSNETL